MNFSPALSGLPSAHKSFGTYIMSFVCIYAWRYSRFPCLRAFEAAISLARTLQCIASWETDVTDVVYFREKNRAMASRSLEGRRFCEQTLSWKQAALFLL